MSTEIKEFELSRQENTFRERIKRSKQHRASSQMNPMYESVNVNDFNFNGGFFLSGMLPKNKPSELCETLLSPGSKMG